MNASISSQVLRTYATPPRTPSPVQFVCRGSSSESHSDHRRSAPLPEFTVTSTPYDKNISSTPGASRLNPAAKEFVAIPMVPAPVAECMDRGAGALNSTPPLFAMPSQRFVAQPSVAADYTYTWDSSMRRTRNDSLSPTSNTSAASAAELDESVIFQWTAAVRHRFTSDCLARRQHMVAVLNLEPRTTESELQSMFFPMGASQAVLVDPLPGLPPLRRRVGVVFFSRKDFAMVGIEKLDNFAPNGQHQPLVVRYGGPDPLSAQPLACAEQPWMLAAAELERAQEEMWAAYQHVSQTLPMVAVHGLDPNDGVTTLKKYAMAGAVDYKLWPSARSSGVRWPCRSISAVIWYQSDSAAQHAIRALDGTVPIGQYHPVLMVRLGMHTPKTRPTAAFDVWAPLESPNAHNYTQQPTNTLDVAEVERHFLAQYAGSPHHLVSVHNLDPQTDKQKLFKIFYPLGAVDAELYPSSIIIAGKMRRSGVALFQSGGMAAEASSRINDFVPNGQTRPLTTRCLVKTASPPPLSPAPLESAAATVIENASSTPRAANTPDALLMSIRRQLKSSTPCAEALASTMVQLVSDSEHNEEIAMRLADVLVGALTSTEVHAKMLATPLAGAIMSLHETLRIPARATRSEDEAEDGNLSRNSNNYRVSFVKCIARAMMILLSNQDAPREARSVAAVLCADMFQFNYIPSTPYAFAVRLLRSGEGKLIAAKEFLSRGTDTPINPAEEQEHRPWVTLVESLEELTSIWRKSRRVKTDKDMVEYEKYINDFYGGNPPRTIPKSDRGHKAQSPSSDALDGARDSAKRVALLTPSARPTPRRVVTRMSPSTHSSAVRCSKIAPEGSSTLSAPLVMLSPGSDYTQGVSADISVDSNHPSLMAQARRAAALAAFTYSAKSPSTAQTDALITPACTPVGARDTAPERRSDPGESTVYITKLPSTLTVGQVHRLLQYFGEFTKVRLYRDNKNVSIAANNARTPNYSQLCFGFVEFLEADSARKAVEYFRNAVHMPNSFNFLRNADCPLLTERDIELLRNTRASPARKPIHDQKPLDAVLDDDLVALRSGAKPHPCLFGISDPTLTIEQFALPSSALRAPEPAMATGADDDDNDNDLLDLVGVAVEEMQNGRFPDDFHAAYAESECDEAPLMEYSSEEKTPLMY